MVPILTLLLIFRRKTEHCQSQGYLTKEGRKVSGVERVWKFTCEKGMSRGLFLSSYVFYCVTATVNRQTHTHAFIHDTHTQTCIFKIYMMWIYLRFVSRHFFHYTPLTKLREGAGGILEQPCLSVHVSITLFFMDNIFWTAEPFWYWNTDLNGQWYQHLFTLFAIFYESNTEVTNFWIMLICFMFVKRACFVLYSTSVGFELVKSPEVTLCGWLGNKPSINK